MELLSVPWSLLSSCCNNVTLLGIFLTAFVLLFDFMKRRKTWTRYPPGPSSIPFLGSMLHVDFQQPHVSFTQLSKKFGNIFSFQICWRNLVVLNGFEVIKEALINKSEDIADRPRLPLYEHLGICGKSAGMILARYGRAWKDLRKFSLSTLRNFGMGKKSLEERIIEEAGFLSSAFESEESRPFDPHFIINNAVSNVICSITFGDRFEYTDEKFQKLLHLFEESMKLATGFLPQTKGDQETTFNELNLLFTTSDLFSAGTETTSTTLRWALLFMLLHPDIQSKVHEEIDQMIGRERKPVLGDQVNMPFTNAVIHESQRCGDIVPIGLPHMAYRDTEILGFFIPKGTVVVTNLSSVLKDETYWEKPHQFYPEHFLNAEGQFVKREAFLPFSAGRRVCLGEQLARMELFIFFTTLMQRFTFLIPENQPKPQLDPCFAVTSSPHPYQICAKLR
ncbi:cytochrome P450 2D15 isoform X2 [Microcaecilia unicolor]|uniref:Cytochrome P450 2D15-like isoform X2 n=1 Tax=Microcaecilia unicolor TaxID=1415580 RepID=A0A6P7YEQ5_9AMPH|nr:cytochrome P450 2D15-like isoform X2 [Microcaecilia unicolor]